MNHSLSFGELSPDSLFESCSVALVFLWFRSVPTFLLVVSDSRRFRCSLISCLSHLYIVKIRKKNDINTIFNKFFNKKSQLYLVK